jgi:hypothetical protein
MKLSRLDSHVKVDEANECYSRGVRSQKD